ncbi:MAG: bacillithiol biosynthesis cysteine-adding enzyme BshC [Saprospiraceae bacterium]|nr:bacillithiol biosynthesis cysteine-adding enzyme BshC [Pyrinomonadaceae bacterium]
MQEIDCPKIAPGGKLRVESLPFGQIPGQSKLFVQYQKDPLSLKKYYPSAVASHTEIVQRIPEVLENHKADRNILCDALLVTNQKFGASAKTFEHIEMLRRTETVAVVTGQQSGLFTGPLYTVYKALSAIKAAECLRGRGFSAVPVFWSATEDNDFAEVSNAFVIGRKGDTSEVRNQPKDLYENVPVGFVKLDDSIEKTIDELFCELGNTEFTDGIRQSIKQSWMPGVHFADAFGTLLTSLLGDSGLIVLDPLNKDLKRLAAPVYVDAIERSYEIVSALRVRSEELSAEGYEAQVLIGEDYFPLFWHADDDSRNALRRNSTNTIITKGGNREFTLVELADIAVKDPTRFSPSVVLRSAVQDYILPTVCYFGGGAEISYFAQSGEVYRILNRPVTPIMHRQSFTLVEPKHSKVLSRYNLNFSDLFYGSEVILPRIVEQFLNKDTARLFADVEEKINTELNRLDQNLSQIDPTLAENLAKRRRKIIYHIGAVRKKFHRVEVFRDETVSRQIDALFTALLPHKHLQERTFNVTTLLNRYGPNVIDWIYDSIDLDDKGHRILYL